MEHCNVAVKFDTTGQGARVQLEATTSSGPDSKSSQMYEKTRLTKVNVVQILHNFLSCLASATMGAETGTP